MQLKVTGIDKTPKGILLSKNTMMVLLLKRKPIYSNFYLTHKGIFRFDNPIYFHGIAPILFSPDLTLPKNYLTTSEIKSEQK